MVERDKLLSRRMGDIRRLTVQEGDTAFTGEYVRPSEKCTGCMSCVAACSLGREGGVSTALSGIRITHHTSEWVLGRSEVLYTSSVCAQCPGVPPCDEVCPNHAHYRDEDTGAIIIDEGLCVRCKKCIDACPFDACWYSDELDKIIKCDLCSRSDEGPQCIGVCPSEILKIDVVE